jgi:hypothetical protein
MQKHTIPYDIAIKKIDEAVKSLHSELIVRQEASFGKLGVLKFNDGRIVYEPSLSYFTHPSIWGCPDLNLNRLSDLLELPQEVHIGRNWRRIFVGVASTAAAVVLWVMMPSISDGMFQTIQRSGFVVQNTLQVAERIDYKPIITTERDAFLDEYAQNIAERATMVPSVVAQQTEETVIDTKLQEQPKPVLKKVKRYYVIIGGDTNKGLANRLLADFRRKGLNNANIVDSSDRYRIYAAVFGDKSEAESYLNHLRNSYSAYNDAWIFTKATME